MRGYGETQSGDDDVGRSDSTACRSNDGARDGGHAPSARTRSLIRPGSQEDEEEDLPIFGSSWPNGLLEKLPVGLPEAPASFAAGCDRLSYGGGTAPFTPVTIGT